MIIFSKIKLKSNHKQARSEDFKRGGGEISNVVVFKKILKN